MVVPKFITKTTHVVIHQSNGMIYLGSFVNDYSVLYRVHNGHILMI